MLQKQCATAAFCIFAINCGVCFADDPSAKEPISLLGVIREWQYPDSKLTSGAEISDAGVKNLSSVKSKTVFTTADSADNVVEYYLKQLKVDLSGKNLGEKEGERITTKRSVTVQDNSAGRSLKLFIISVNEKQSSTTLVISRSEGEETTHIAWSNFRQLSP